MTSSLYFESHITVEPVFEERLEQFVMLCKQQNFQVAKLLMQKRASDNPERSKNDSFCTGYSQSIDDLQERMVKLLSSLKENNFQIWRFKIENIVLDSRHDDKIFRLDKAILPEKELKYK